MPTYTFSERSLRDFLFDAITNFQGKGLFQFDKFAQAERGKVIDGLIAGLVSNEQIERVERESLADDRQVEREEAIASFGPEEDWEDLYGPLPLGYDAMRRAELEGDNVSADSVGLVKGVDY